VVDLLQCLSENLVGSGDRCGGKRTEAHKKPRHRVSEMVGAPQRPDLQAGLKTTGGRSVVRVIDTPEATHVRYQVRR
jgi:hypothetical protein